MINKENYWRLTLSSGAIWHIAESKIDTLSVETRETAERAELIKYEEYCQYLGINPN